MSKPPECPTCGQDGFANEKGMKKHHYMVHDEKLGVVEVKCYECGDTVEKKTAAIVGKTFCDSSCYGDYLKRTTPRGENHPDYKGGNYQNYGYNWEEQRQKALERDFHQCRSCMESPDLLHVHHRTPWDSFESNERANKVENLLTLCPSCHANIEQSNMTA